MRRSTAIIICCVGFIAGNVLGYYFLFGIGYWWYVFLGVALVSVFIAKGFGRVSVLASTFVILGIILMSVHLNYTASNGLGKYSYKNVELQGNVKGDGYWDEDGNYVFVMNNLTIEGKKLVGEIKIKTFSASAKEDYTMLVGGKVFPTRAKPGYQISYAKTVIVAENQTILTKLKNLLYTGADRAFDKNTAGFVKGVLVGARSLLSKDSQDTMNAVGLSHVVAVSGYNLTILVVLLQRILRRRWAWGGLAISLVLVWCFTLLTGASASILRAAIMSSVFLLASFYGRQLSIFVCISATAAITLLINPTSVVQDIGWQLSFLSLIGIVILAPILEKLTPKKISALSDILVVTVAAQIATVPYIMYLFGNYSLMSFVSNFVVMPLIPFIMLVGFVISLMALVVPSIAVVFGNILDFVVINIFEFLKYLQGKSEFIVSIRPSMEVLIAWYVLLSFLGLIVYNKGLSSRLEAYQNQSKYAKIN